MIDARRLARQRRIAVGDVRVLRDVRQDALVGLHGLGLNQKGTAQGATATAGDVRAKARGDQPDSKSFKVFQRLVLF